MYYLMYYCIIVLFLYQFLNYLVLFSDVQVRFSEGGFRFSERGFSPKNELRPQKTYTHYYLPLLGQDNETLPVHQSLYNTMFS